jgi:hypothetical protein
VIKTGLYSTDEVSDTLSHTYQNSRRETKQRNIHTANKTTSELGLALKFVPYPFEAEARLLNI